MRAARKTSPGSLVRRSCLVGIGLLEGLGCAPRDVHGTAVEAWGSPDNPESLHDMPWSRRTIQAVPAGGAAADAHSATVDEKGEFLITGAPTSAYWLVFPDELTAFRDEGNTYVWTAASEFDLGLRGLPSYVGGTARMPMPTPITGLKAVETYDSMEAYGTSQSWSMTWLLPTPGAVSTTWPADQAIPFRVTPSEQILVKQWQGALHGPLNVQTVVRAGRAAAPADASTEVPVMLSDATPAAVDVQIDHAAIMGQLAGIQGPLEVSFKLMADSDPSDYMPGDKNLLVKVSNGSTAVGDPSAGRLSYVDPYPASWSRRYQLTYMNFVDYLVDGTTGGTATCRAGLTLFGTASELGHGPLRPNLSLPQQLAMDGSSAMVGREDVALTPTITWQPPQIGESVLYLLRIMQVVKMSERGYRDQLAGSFLTPKTEAKIPEGVLKPAGQYYLELIAVGGLGEDAMTRPRAAVAASWSQSSAHVCSASFHTQR